MKKILVPLFSLVVLSGCFGGGGSNDTNASEVAIVKKIPIQISVPKAWREVQAADLKGLSGETVLAYVSLNYTGGFANNLTITQETLPNAITSVQYADANIINSAKYLTDYVKLAEKEVTIKSDNDADIPTKLQIFQARFDKLEPQRKYLQLYAVWGNIGYTATVTVTLDEQDTSKYENLLTSFRFVKE